MFISHSLKTLLLTTSCAALLLAGGASANAQAAEAAIDYLYVSPAGSDSWSGQSPTPAAGGAGPFQTLAHARDAVHALEVPALPCPVEVVLDPGVCRPDETLAQWFSGTPSSPVIWHADPQRTVLIYTRTAAEQVDALSAEDYAPAGGVRATRFYVSAAGSDEWTGKNPSPDGGDGPFRTLEHAQEAVSAVQSDSPSTPIDVVFESGAPAALAAPAAPKAHSASAEKPKSTEKPKYTADGLAALQVLSVPHGTGVSKTTNFRWAGAAPGVLAAGGAAAPHLVFAHYMVCNRDFGGSVAGYEKEIQQAQAAGIDGFALNCGSWNQGLYKHDVASLFQAAETLNTGFKLFFSADMTGLSLDEIRAMMLAYSSRPNYWHVSQVVSPTVTVSRPVLSTWGGEGGGFAAKTWWTNDVVTPLKNAGVNVYFLPFFAVTSPDGKQYLDASPSNVAAQINGLLKGLADGSFYAPSVGNPVAPSRTMLNSAESQAAQLKAAGFGTLGSVSPQYWGSKQVSIGRRYLEYDGGEGLTAQWESLITVQKPDWVEMFTWNDWDEATYFSPMDDVNKYWPYTAHSALGYYKSHAGALKLSQYYINWYKSGVKPAVTTDSLYYFYRTHPKNAAAPNDKVGGVSWFIGGCPDTVFVTTILTAPATLVVTTGPKTQTYPVPAGVSSTRIAFQVGAQAFRLVRKGKTVASVTGDPIAANPPEYNFNYSTGSAASQAAH